MQLTLNDLVRRRFTDPETGRIKLWQELVAGGAAGAGQVVRPLVKSWLLRRRAC